MANPKRTTNIAVVIEGKNVHKARTTAIAIMIEYRPPVVYTRKLGPPVQVSNC